MQRRDQRLSKDYQVSENVGDVAMHELYLWPFQDAVRAGTGAIMCSCKLYLSVMPSNR